MARKPRTEIEPEPEKTEPKLITGLELSWVPPLLLYNGATVCSVRGLKQLTISDQNLIYEIWEKRGRDYPIMADEVPGLLGWERKDRP